MITISQIEATHLSFLTGSFVTGVKSLHKAMLVYSDELLDSAWNYILPSMDCSISLVDIKNQLKIVENPMTSIAVHTRNDTLQVLLDNHHYSLLFSDAWMILNKYTYISCYLDWMSLTPFYLNSNNDDFIKIFFESYTKKTELDLYEFDVNKYYIIERLLMNNHQKKVVVISINNRPAACGLVMLHHNIAGLYCVGVSHQYRTKGVGTVLVHHLIQQAFSCGADTIFLQTEANSHLEKWYQRFGFQILEVTRYYGQQGELLRK